MAPRQLQSEFFEPILADFRGVDTERVMQSLAPGQRKALRVRRDGPIMNGNHRIAVLRERGIDAERPPQATSP